MPLMPTIKSLEQSVPGLRGAIVCDEEGERVVAHITDATLAPFDLYVLGATYAALGPKVDETLTYSGHIRFRVVCADQVTWYQSLRHGYYLVLATVRSPRAGLIPDVLESAAAALSMDM